MMLQNAENKPVEHCARVRSARRLLEESYCHWIACHDQVITGKVCGTTCAHTYSNVSPMWKQSHLALDVKIQNL